MNKVFLHFLPNFFLLYLITFQSFAAPSSVHSTMKNQICMAKKPIFNLPKTHFFMILLQVPRYPKPGFCVSVPPSILIFLTWAKEEVKPKKKSLRKYLLYIRASTNVMGLKSFWECRISSFWHCYSGPKMKKTVKF